jgi:hypothetical protein
VRRGVAAGFRRRSFLGPPCPPFQTRLRQLRELSRFQNRRRVRGTPGAVALMWSSSYGWVESSDRPRRRPWPSKSSLPKAASSARNRVSRDSHMQAPAQVSRSRRFRLKSNPRACRADPTANDSAISGRSVPCAKASSTSCHDAPEGVTDRSSGSALLRSCTDSRTPEPSRRATTENSEWA